MDKKITWSGKAEKKFLDILDFWIEHNQSVAFSEKLIDEVSARLSLIAQFPHIGIQCNAPRIRYIILRFYRIYYEDIPSEIRVLFIWDMRQNPGRLPKKYT